IGVRFLSRTTAAHDRRSAPELSRTKARPRAEGVSRHGVSGHRVSGGAGPRAVASVHGRSRDADSSLRPDARGSAIAMIPASRLRRNTRVLLVSSIVTIVVVLAGWVVFTLCAARLVTSMYRSESWSVLNNLIRDRAHTPLDYYFESARVQFSRLVMLAVCMQAIVVAALLRRETWRTVVDFFTARSSPVNLAVLRIVFFAVLFQFVDVEHVVWFSQI